MLTRPMLSLCLFVAASLTATAPISAFAQSLLNSVETYIQQRQLPESAQQAEVTRKAKMRVFFHLRDEGQRPLADRAADVVRGLNTRGLEVEIPDYQIVPFGPGRSDFRTLTKPLEEDPFGTGIFEALRTVIPDILYNDLSQRYEESPLVRPGTYELWLGPEVR